MSHTFKQRSMITSLRKTKLLMAPYKHYGELFPDRRGLMFRFVGRGRRFGRLMKFTSSMWILFTSAIFLILFTIFGLRLLFPGYMEDVVSSSQGLRIGVVSIGNGIGYSQEVQVSGVGKNDKIVRPPLIQGVLNEQSGSRIFRPPSRKRRLHLPCEVEFSESVDYMVEPNNVRNFSEFALDYVAVEENYLGTSSFDPKFGGHQTLVERERSFYARDQTVHCGFVKGATGLPSTEFDLDEEDKAYMRTCKVVVSSCIFGNSDFLRRPTSKKISDFSKKNVCFVMFVDEQTLSKLSSDGHVLDDGGHVGLWRVVVVRNLPYEDMRRTGKVPKLLSHRLFPSARYSIWIDSKLRLNADPMLIIEYFLWRPRAEYAISNHYDRHCVWEEVLQNKRLNKYNQSAIDEQFQFYQSDRLTRFDPSDPNTPLPSFVPEGSFIVRAHTAMSNLFSCLWFNEVDRFTSRDQLSFGYTYLKLRRLNPDQPFYLHMFKDCERRALAKLFRHRVASSSQLAL